MINCRHATKLLSELPNICKVITDRLAPCSVEENFKKDFLTKFQFVFRFCCSTKIFIYIRDLRLRLIKCKMHSFYVGQRAIYSNCIYFATGTEVCATWAHTSYT